MGRPDDQGHRADVRRYFGFRECSVADADKAAEWLAANVCEKERQVDQVREELLAHLKGEQIEPPARDRVRRIIGTAMRQAEQALTARIASRIPAEAAARMLALIARAADPGDEEEAAPGEAGTLFGSAGCFQALREKLRCKEIWVGRRGEMAQPRPRPAGRLRGQAGRELRPAPQAAGSQAVHRRAAGGTNAEMSALNDALGGKGLAWLKIAERRGAGRSTSRRWTPRLSRGTCAG